MKKSLLLLLASTTLVLAEPASRQDIVQSILANPGSPFYVDLAHYPRGEAGLPVGVFDSGTGGLTVLNAIVEFDEHDNQSGAEGADGIPDLQKEDFVYLADQANMPYGNYPSAGKTDLLLEHILKCARFLLGPNYYGDGPRQDKKPIKAMVIACNTATAYGKEQVERLLRQGGSDLKVIGVIDAGSRGALSTLRRDEDATIAIFATAGTVASGGYVRALDRLRSELGYTGQIQTISHGGVGLAEAIDEEPNFLDRQARSPRSQYRGPAVTGDLLPYYRFDRSDGHLLDDGCGCLQINSADNYVRYHMVAMLEAMRTQPRALPLKTMILGCTHYPYVRQTITQVLGELRQDDRYQGLIAPQVELVDPSRNTARELYDYLQQHKLANFQGSLRNSEFYISVPNPEVPGVALEGGGSRFTYDYKYGREAGQDREFVRVTPFSRANIPQEVAQRLKAQIPAVFSLIEAFDRTNPKTAYLRPEQRF